MDSSPIQFVMKRDSAGKLVQETLQPSDTLPTDADFVWVHLLLDHSDCVSWLERVPGLNPIVLQALSDPETSPRHQEVDQGYILVLRGVSAEDPDDPELMVSLRVWVTPNLLISVSRRPIAPLNELRETVSDGQDLVVPAYLVFRMIRGLMRPVREMVKSLVSQVDVLEEQEEMPAGLLIERQRECLFLARHLAPFEEAIEDLLEDPPPWWDSQDFFRMKHLLQRCRHMVQETLLLKERVKLLQDQFDAQTAAEMNRRLYIFSVIALLFLPLSFITGLFGINVGGIPGSSWEGAFAVFCGALVLGSLGFCWGLRRLNWI